jgi:pimeloyl-ACP methyl ester carboxylesterase
MSQAIRHRSVEVNGIRMHIAELGSGPLVLMCHGWPELWYSWRHQMPALAEAGFHVVAPDMRGFGQTDAPLDVQAYSVLHLVGDMVGLVEVLGEKSALIIGHDWGAPIAWHSAMFRPDVFRAVVGMSVPHRTRGSAAPLQMLRQAGLDGYYWFYFQTQAAELEFERDVPTTLRKLLCSLEREVPRDRPHPLVVAEGGGFLDGVVVPDQLPSWLQEDDVQTFAAEYQRTGFRGGLNLYRNLDRNWELTAPWAGARIEQPALFLAGTHDPVIAGRRGERALADMKRCVPNLQQRLFDGAGHWIQQERAAEVNSALLEFLKPLA